MKPILSIVIPCYNSESTLEGTLESVLHQDFQDWEAIIVNDGSPDNVETIALTWLEKDERFKYYKKQNGGLGSARNYGISKAKGEFILPLDSDNQVKEDYALKAISVFTEKRNVGVVYGMPNIMESEQVFGK
ncbi:glycosyltransferase family 2 protein [Jejuia pallidilutea]|uniref:glycosyltransferase family 2 protein n=1 Tax=Jejuia pallidilutea TaxID=504487 RepID=UPI0006945FEB|nr:glycosyltransferase family A protein [Jejuia pallidilutea]